MLAPKGGLRIGGITFREGDTIPRRYRRALEEGRKESLRPKDPAALLRDVPPNFGRAILPHIMTFSGMSSTLSKTYRQSDEAMRHSVENAHMMVQDPMVMGPLLARQEMVALYNWHIEPEDDKDRVQKGLCQELTTILKRMPRFVEYRRFLLNAIWYGRYAAQHQFGFHTDYRGNRRTIVTAATPLSGDKLAFRYDDGRGQHDYNQVGVKVSAGLNHPDAIAGDRRLEPTADGMAYFLEPWERSRLAVHKHLLWDGDYEDPLSAGKIHGVGLRSFIYWCWYQKQETLAQLMELVERTGMGFIIYYYPIHNADAKAEVEKIAQEQSHTNRLLVPHDLADPDAYRVEQIPPNTAGVEILRAIVNEHFGAQITKFILGQTLSTDAAATGLGSGVAQLHEKSLLNKARYDAINLEETITRELLWPLRDFNFPKYRSVALQFKIDTESSTPQEDLEGAYKLWQMGAELKASDLFDKLGLAMPSPTDLKLANPQLQHLASIVDQRAQAAEQGLPTPGMPGMGPEDDGAGGLPPGFPPGGPPEGPDFGGGDDGGEPEDGPQNDQGDEQPEQNDASDVKRIFGPILHAKPHPSPDQKGLFDEHAHPRSTDGRFSSKPGSDADPAPSGAAADEPFSLTQGGGKRGPYGDFAGKGKEKQKALFSGLDSLPGQQDLFDDLDKPADKFATAPKSPVAKITSNHTGHMDGQDDFVLHAHDAGGDVIGKLHYSLYDGELFVRYVEVPPHLRRQGIAREMYRAALAEHPAATLGKSMTTPDGAALRQAIDKEFANRLTPPPPERPEKLGPDEWAAMWAALDNAPEGDRAGIVEAMNAMHDYDDAVDRWAPGDEPPTRPQRHAKSLPALDSFRIRDLIEKLRRGDEFGARKLLIDAGVDPLTLDSYWRDIVAAFSDGRSPSAPLRHAKESPERDLAQAIAAAAEETHASPSEAQVEAGNYKKGKVWVHGLEVAIENPKGSKRREEWPPLSAHYGYIKRHEGADGDQVDVFLGPNPESQLVFIVDQVKPSGRFDEHKVLIGWTNLRQARAAYRANYTADWKVGPITPMTIGQFRKWLASADLSKPASRWKPARFARDMAEAQRFAGRRKSTKSHSHKSDEGDHARGQPGNRGQFGYAPKRKKTVAQGQRDFHWVTIDGTHVAIDDDTGEITKGPKALVGKSIGKAKQLGLFDDDDSGSKPDKSEDKPKEKPAEHPVTKPPAEPAAEQPAKGMTAKEIDQAARDVSDHVDGDLAPYLDDHDLLFDAIREVYPDLDHVDAYRIADRLHEVFRDDEPSESQKQGTEERLPDALEQVRASASEFLDSNPGGSWRDWMEDGGRKLLDQLDGGDDEFRSELESESHETIAWGAKWKPDDKPAANEAPAQSVPATPETPKESQVEPTSAPPPVKGVESSAIVAGAEGDDDVAAAEEPADAFELARRLTEEAGDLATRGDELALMRQLVELGQREGVNPNELWMAAVHAAGDPRDILAEVEAAIGAAGNAAAAPMAEPRKAGRNNLSTEKGIRDAYENGRITTEQALAAIGKLKANPPGDPHWYGLTNRPFGPTHKQDAAGFKTHPKFTHGLVGYQEPLTAEEIASQELTPILDERHLPAAADAVMAKMGDYVDSYLEPGSEELLEDFVSNEAPSLGHVDPKALADAIRARRAGKAATGPPTQLPAEPPSSPSQTPPPTPSGPFDTERPLAFNRRLNAGEVSVEAEGLPAGSFGGNDAFRQTGVNTKLVVINKPGGESAAEKYARKKSAPGQVEFNWITIGGRQEGDKKHAGGTPVAVDGSGKIVKGPDSLEGRKVHELRRGAAGHGRGEPAHPRSQSVDDDGDRREHAISRVRASVNDYLDEAPSGSWRDWLDHGGGRQLLDDLDQGDDRLRGQLESEAHETAAWRAPSSAKKAPAPEETGGDVEPSARAGGQAAPPVAGGKKSRSRATVRISGAVDQGEAVRMLGRLFPKAAGDDGAARTALASSVGAPDTADVEIIHAGKYLPYHRGGERLAAQGMLVRIGHPDLKEAVRFVGIDGEGRRFIKNETISVRTPGNGIGSQIFARQVENAADEGFEYITTHAVGDPTSAAFNGYYTWPRMGYDQAVSSLQKSNPAVYNAVKQAWPNAASVQDVISTPEGLEWWKAHGGELHQARFDLRDGSRSRVVLDEYLRKKAEESNARRNRPE